MKKVIFVLWHVSGKGGTETVVRTVVREMLKNHSHLRPQVYVLGGTEDTKWLENIHFGSSPYIRNKLFRVIPYFIWLMRYIRKENPDIVIGLSPMICLFLNTIRKITRKKYSIFSWIHFSLKANQMKKEWLKNADYHLAISSGVRRQLVELGIPNAKIFTIYNPVKRINTTIYRPEKIKVFVYVGRITFDGQKRISDMFTALSLVSGPWHLDIVGDGDDVDQCKKYAEQLNISQKISWNGWKQDPWSVINRATALLLTSSYEGFPMVLTEAISRGVYCVSSDCEVGPSDIIKKDINGELYEVGNSEALKQILQEIVDGKYLPDQDQMKASLEPFYLEHYYESFIKAIENIIERNL